ncbi:hypothetical protein [Streptomyces sp. NPDC058272]
MQQSLARGQFKGSLRRSPKALVHSRHPYLAPDHADTGFPSSRA